MPAIMHSIAVTARCAKQYRGDRLAESGLNGCQAPYILHICRRPGIPQESLAGLIYANKSNVARQLAALEAAGFVRRAPSGTDKRAVLVYPTEKALSALPLVQETFKSWGEYLTEDFTDAEREALTALLARVMDRATAYVDGRKKDDKRP